MEIRGKSKIDDDDDAVEGTERSHPSTASTVNPRSLDDYNKEIELALRSDDKTNEREKGGETYPAYLGRDGKVD